jgi:flagellar motor switch protein FliM
MSRETTCDSLSSGTMTPRELGWLQTMHEGMPRALAASLSAVVRSPVEVSLVGVDQLAYGKFLGGLGSPSYFTVLKAELLGDCVILDIDLAILYPMLDGMLGGSPADEPPPRRSLSDIELPLAGRITRLFLECLGEAWQRILPIEFEVLQVESQPRRLRVLPSDESVVIVGFTVTIGNRQGTIWLCVPSRAVRQIGDRLEDDQSQRSSSDSENTSGDGNGTRCAEVVVTLATTPLAACELRGLRVGDIIATESEADVAAVVSIDGEPRFHARPGACHGRKAVVLAEAIGDSAEKGV